MVAKQRRSRGAMLTLVAVFGMFMVLLALVFVALELLLNGSNGLQAAVDSGSLNVSKDSLIRLYVHLQTTEQERQFSDLAQLNPELANNGYWSGSPYNNSPIPSGGSAEGGGGGGGTGGGGTANGNGNGGDNSSHKNQPLNHTDQPNSEANQNHNLPNNGNETNGNTSSAGAGSNQTPGSSSNQPHNPTSSSSPSQFGQRQTMGGGLDAGSSSSSTTSSSSSQPVIKMTSAPPAANNPGDGDPTTQVSLSNVNQIIARALMIGMNEQGMETQSASTAISKQHAQSVLDAGDSISKRLINNLNQENVLKQVFLRTAKGNKVRSLGQPDAEISPYGGSWLTGYVDQGAPSNTTIKQTQIPEGFDASQLHFASGQGVDPNLLSGYLPDTVLSKDLEFVPLTPYQQPHLVSRKAFYKKPTQIDPKSTVPNAFAMGASVAWGDMKLSGQACAQSELVAGSIPTEIKHGFIRIKVNPNVQKFFINDQETDNWYNQAPAIYVAYTSTKMVMAEYQLSNELGVQKPTLKDVLFPPTAGSAGYQKLHRALAQRAAQIDCTISATDIDNLLSQKQIPDFDIPNSKQTLQKDSSQVNYTLYTVAPTEQVFYLVRPEGGHLMLLKDSEVLSKAPWMAPFIALPPDGNPLSVVGQDMGDGNDKVIYKSRFVTSVTFQVQQAQALSLSTGYNGILTEINEQRTTQVKISTH